ncbi:MAG TPA: YIP1 family protein [Verrucomicrobiae bacterium]|nr:YIP1 family protein [Verrucomicrobiae bacterium]
MLLLLLMMFDPMGGWSRAAASGRSVVRIFLIHLLPLLLLGCVAEGAGMVHWGKSVGEFGALKVYPLADAVRYEACQFGLLLLIVLIGAVAVKNLGNTFHVRERYLPALTVCVFGLGPIFLLRVLDAFPTINPWISYAIGAVLMAMVLYQGLPHVMRPDPAHAFGYYVSTVTVLLLLTALGRMLVVYRLPQLALKFGWIS